MNIFHLLVLGILAVRPAAERDDLDLLAALQATDLEKFRTEEASAFLDIEGKALTFTFRYTNGEPEIRIPVAAVGWPQDWSPFKSLVFQFETTSLEPVAVGFSAGDRTRLAILEPFQGIRIRGVIPFEVFTQTRTMTPLRPLGYKVWVQRLFTFEKVEEVIFRMRRPNQASQMTIYSLALAAEVPADDILDRRPLIDRYGQWIPEQWQGKAHSDDQLREMWRRDQLEPLEYSFCPLGGDATRRVPSSGYFQTRQIDGAWVLVDPHGHPFYSSGMDLVGYNPSSYATDISGREYIFEKLPPPGPCWLTPGKIVSFYMANVMMRFGDDWQAKWADHTVARLKNWGFNTIANWSDREIAIHSKMPYVLPLQGWTTKKVFPFPYDFPDVFSSEFEENVDAAARAQVAPLKDDPNLIGWFLGNEPHWARSFGALQLWPDMLLADPEPSATKAKLRELLAANPERAEEIRNKFLYTCAQRYFETVTRAVRKHDPNHLVLGIRFAEQPDDRWARLSSMFDVFSINIYTSRFAPDAEMVRRYSEVSGRPVMIGEFTAAAPGRGLQGLFYFVHKVRDQAERGVAYRYYVENSAASPYIIGTHWFQMVDDLPSGRPSDEERLNYGFINVLDLPYPELVEAARKTHRRIYDLKFNRTQPFSTLPIGD